MRAEQAAANSLVPLLQLISDPVPCRRKYLVCAISAASLPQTVHPRVFVQGCHIVASVSLGSRGWGWQRAVDFHARDASLFAEVRTRERDGGGGVRLGRRWTHAKIRAIGVRGFPQDVGVLR